MKEKKGRTYLITATKEENKVFYWTGTTWANHLEYARIYNDAAGAVKVWLKVDKKVTDGYKVILHRRA